MKKFLLALAVASTTLAASADKVAFYADGFDYTGEATAKTAFVNAEGTSQCVGTYKAGDVTLVLSTENTNIPGVYSGLVRFYQSAQMTLTVPDGVTITEIYCQTGSGSKGAFSVVPADAGTIVGTGSDANNPITWTGAGKGTLTLNADKQVRFSYMEVTYTSGVVMETTAAPTFTPASGTTFGAEGIKVTIAAADGAKIYYTLDGTEPTAESTLYSAPIELKETTSILAMAQEEGKNPSAVASATYVYEAPLNPDQTEVEFVFADNEWENGFAITEPLTKDGVTLTFADGGNSNGPKYYTTGTGIRMYPKNTLTVSADKKIDYIDFTFSEAAYTFDSLTPENTDTPTVAVTPGSYTGVDAAGKWVVGDNLGTLTLSGTKGSARLQAVKVVLNTAAVVTPITEAPVFTPEACEFSEDLTVSIAAADGAKIYYTLDGAAPTEDSDLYVAPIVLTKTTTVKAIAVEEGKKPSAVVSATYTYAEPINTLAKLIELGLEDETTEFTYTGTAVVTYQNGSNLYVQDETAAILVYGSGLPEYKNGDRLTGFKGKFKNYYSTYELMATASSFGEAQEGAEVAPEVIDLEDITPEMQNKYVEVKNVLISGDKLVDAKDADMPFYNKFKIEVPAESEETYDVVALINYYQAKDATEPSISLYPISFTGTTGLTAVAAEGQVLVLGRNIVAPADAAIYSANGTRVAGTDLAAGLYIVKLADGAAVKVLVK